MTSPRAPLNTLRAWSQHASLHLLAALTRIQVKEGACAWGQGAQLAVTLQFTLMLQTFGPRGYVFLAFPFCNSGFEQ